MRKLIFLVVAAIVFTACQQSGPERWTRSSPEVKVTKALVTDYVNGSWDSWLSHYSDTAKVFHNTTTGATPQQLMDALRNDIQKLAYYNFSEKEIFYEMIIDDNNDKWVYFWGTWEAKVRDINKPLEIPVHLAMQFVNNKIVREYGYYDNSSIIKAFAELESMPN